MPNIYLQELRRLDNILDNPDLVKKLSKGAITHVREQKKYLEAKIGIKSHRLSEDEMGFNRPFVKACYSPPKYRKLIYTYSER